jgi:NAD+ kinase
VGPRRLCHTDRVRLGFLLKRGKPEAPSTAAELAEGLLRRGHRVLALAEDSQAFTGAEAVPPERFAASIDVLVVLGGDGTFLHGASLVADQGVPLLGINLGHLGFMTHHPVEEAHAAVEAVSEGKLAIVERMRLRVAVRSGGRESVVHSALNEAVISQRTLARLIDLAVEFDGDGSTTYKADGLIVSTPTGSTAYNLAAGGPILSPDLEAVVVCPICPHTLTNRPVVMKADGRFLVTNIANGPVALTVDGHWSREVAVNDSVEIRKAERPLRTFRTHQSFFDILRQKLSWGERAEFAQSAANARR